MDQIDSIFATTLFPDNENHILDQWLLLKYYSSIFPTAI